MSRVQEYAETLYRVLRTTPCNTYEEICQGMQEDWPGISKGSTSNTLHWIRGNVDEAGFDVGYVKHGSPGWSDTGGRYFIINKDDRSFKLSDNQRDHLDQGFLSMIATIQTLLENKSKMLDAEQVHESSRIQRECLADLQDDINASARKMARHLRAIQQKRNGTDG